MMSYNVITLFFYESLNLVKVKASKNIKYLKAVKLRDLFQIK